MKFEFEELSFDVPVDHFSQFPRRENGTCALCNDDPCAERDNAKEKRTFIHELADHPKFWNYYQSCPFCDGRPI